MMDQSETDAEAINAADDAYVVPDGIAVIGLAGRFPGASDVRHFWRNLCDGVESISCFEPDDLEDTFSATQRAGAGYVAARPVLDGIEMFDPGFFGMLPREAALTDPQHRVFLECCWEAFEDAGHDPAGANAGVFAGCSMPTYFLHHVCADRDTVDAFVSGYQVENYQHLLGALGDVLATRVSYKLDLRGPSMTVQTACSTSLVAVAQACQALLLQQCDMALAGGVSISVPQRRGYRYAEGGMVSVDGHCRPFDAEASGTVFGSGCGVVLLKRLADALRDGDRVYAVVKGAALNNDGAAKVGFTAPSIDAQAAVIATAHAIAGVEAGSIGYVECHGTATPLGDPIEVAGLSKAFRETTNATGFCAIGSVKGNVGHLDCAAGVTGLIKTALALHEGVIPPTMHFRSPNPQLGLAGSPFFVADRLTPWPAMAAPRRAGVSAFGVGGTNAHVVLEAAPPVPATSPGRQPHLLVLSARSDAALARARAALAERLAENDPPELADVAHSLRRGRRGFAHRWAVVATDRYDAIARLTGAAGAGADTGVAAEPPPVLFLFPGQGSQSVGMGADLYRDEPVFRATMDRCTAILRPLIGLDLATALYGATASAEALDQTALAQPAIFAVSYALAQQWMSWGIRPDAMIGHSVGEFVAATLAGVFRLEDALAVVAARGRLMQSLPGGVMLAVRLPEAELRPLLPAGVDLAAVNGPASCVAAGVEAAVAALEQALAARGTLSRRLAASHAFHSAMMEPIRVPLAETLAAVPLAAPGIPYVSCVTGGWITPAEACSPDYWVRHCRAPVRFADGLATLLADQPAPPVLLEIGGGTTLTTLARIAAPAGAATAIIASLPDASQMSSGHHTMAAALGRLWTAGGTVNWGAVNQNRPGRQVSLPSYPFERARHWIDVARGAAEQSSADRNARAPSTQVLPVPGLSPLPLPLVTQSATPELHLVNHSRDAEIRSAIIATMQGLSGDDIAASADTATFLDMGFDSLLLSQAAQEIQGRFGVKLGFRQLLAEQPNVAALTRYIAAALPQIQSAPAVAPSATPVSAIPSSAVAPGPASLLPMVAATGMPLAASGAVPANGVGSVEGLFQAQLQTMQQVMAAQLDVLHRLGQAASASILAQSSPASIPALPPPVPALQAAPMLAPPPRPAASASVSDGTVELPHRFTRFGAASRPTAELNPAQRQFLDAFIARETTRTARSKALTQADRTVLADPRAAAGFRAEWKELVYPVVCERSEGARLWDIDGNEYIDLVNGFGATLFGHNPSFVRDAVAAQLGKGFPIGPQAELAGKVAALIAELTGSQRVTFCCTGSEAVMGALRLARAVTGRKRVAAFAGAYHGGFDEVLARGLRIGGTPRSLPAAAGVTAEAVANLVLLDYGDPASLEWVRAHSGDLAAVLVEPVQSRHPNLQPRAFLHELRAVTAASGTALIFDELVTGFRLHPGGAQALFGVRADLATYGKVLGGGLPIGVLAGEPRFMDALDGGGWRYGDDSVPEAAVTVFAGTFVRHPLALAAAHAVLTHLKAAGPALQEHLGVAAAALAGRLNAFLAARGITSRIEQCGGMMFFNPAAEDRRASLMFHLLREHGIHVQENFPLFLTTAHGEAELDAIATGFEAVVVDLQSVGILAGSAPAVQAVLPAEPPAQVKLTEPQLEIWLAAQFGDDASCAFNESLSLVLSGPLDLAALHRALDDLGMRHDALRLRFSPDGDVMYVALKAGAPLTEIDLSAAGDHPAGLAGVLAAEAVMPFNLVAGPLLRWVLVRRAANDHVLVLTVHHIVCDGWSTGVLLADLAALYDARRMGRQAELPPAPSFLDHARRERTDSGAAQADAAYWTGRFAALPPPLELPLDRPRPARKSFRGATVSETIDAGLYQAVRTTATGLGCTPFTALLAVFGLMIGRLANQPEVVVDVPTAGQPVAAAGGLVGHCVNFLPIRARWDADTTLARHLAAMQDTLSDAREHPRCTLGTLVRRLNMPRDPNRLPLTDVQFNLDRIAAPPAFGGLSVAVEANPKAFVNFDLFFNLVETAEGLRLDCDYSTDLLDEATVRRWIEHYRSLLRALVADASVTVARAPLFDLTQRSAVLARAKGPAFVPPVQGNAQGADQGRPLGFHDLFDIQARRRPDAIAAECDGTSWTYRMLDRRVEEVATHLRARVDTPDARIGVLLERSLDLPAALLAVARAGFTYVPLDPYQPLARLCAIIERSDLAALLTDGVVPVPESCAVRQIDLRGPLYPVAVRSPAALAASPLAYVIYTSGSTGMPKGVEIGHAALTNLLRAMAERPGLAEEDTLLAVTTIGFDIAALELLLPLTVGARLVIARRDEAADGFALLRRIQTQGVTVFQTTPVTWGLLLEAGFRSWPGLKMLCGGEALQRALADRLLHGGGTLWNMYGPTETTIWSSAGMITTDSGPITIGQPILNTSLYVLDQHDELVAPGAAGQLHIGGSGIARGYFRDQALTNAKFVADPFAPGGRMYRTGDRARLLPDGGIEVLGRIDNQIKLRGFRIEPGEIEAALLTRGGVAAAVVVLRHDPPRTTRLVAYYVPKAGQPHDAAELRAAVTEVLPDYMIPAAFVRLDAMPLNPNGKVDQRALPVPDVGAEARTDARVTLATPVQRRLGAIWQDVLGITEVGAADDLLALGADSIHIFQIAARASRAGIAVAAQDLLRHRTIAALETMLDAARETKLIDVEDATRGPPRLSQFRRRGPRG